MRTIEQRFLQFVGPPNSNGCWIWTGALGSNGYGNFLVRKKLMPAHRYSWEFHNGPIPDKLLVLHTCDSRACVNPAHLFLGTYKDNAQDMLKKGRGNKCRGEKAVHAKLTKQQVLQIRQLIAEGKGLKELADRFKVSSVAIFNIKKRISWAHIK